VSAECQRCVSPVIHAVHVTQTDTDMLIAQLISGGTSPTARRGQATATAGIVERARASEEPALLVAAALITSGPVDAGAPDLMARAMACASTTRDRQLVAIATAHLAGESARVDALAREHLVDFPGSVLVSWIAAAANPRCLTWPPSTQSNPHLRP
jgi:hypothetical protein